MCVVVPSTVVTLPFHCGRKRFLGNPIHGVPSFLVGWDKDGEGFVTLELSDGTTIPRGKESKLRTDLSLSSNFSLFLRDWVGVSLPFPGKRFTFLRKHSLLLLNLVRRRIGPFPVREGSVRRRTETTDLRLSSRS